LLAPESIEATSKDVKRYSVSSLDLSKAEQEVGTVTANRSVTGTSLSVAGKKFDKGVGMYAPGRLMLRLAPGALRFTAQVGVDDFELVDESKVSRIPNTDGTMRLTRDTASGEQFIGITDKSGNIPKGSVVFRLLDGERELWTSGVMKKGETAKRVDIDVRGVSWLTLTVDNDGDSVSGGYADWIDAEILHLGPPPVSVSKKEMRDDKRQSMSMPAGVSGFLAGLPVYPGRQRPESDWLLDNSSFKSALYKGDRADELVMDNGLVSRVFKLSPNTATIDIYDHNTGRTLLRGIKPEATLQIGSKSYYIGGLDGQPDYGYLDYAWLDDLQLMPNAFILSGISTSPIKPRMKWARERRADKFAQWPPDGIELAMQYTCNELPGVEVTVHYNLYDGIPLFCKWFTLKQNGKKDIELETYQSDLLALTEYNITINKMYIDLESPPQTIIFETDYAFGGMNQVSTSSRSIEFMEDPEYTSQVNYSRKSRLLAVSRPEYGTHVLLKTGDTFQSHRTWELVTDSYERERRSLAQRKMYRTVAPWVTENPSVMHIRHARRVDEASVKKGIDDCAAIGFDSAILTFGSGANIENMSQENLNYLKKLADYAKSKGVEIGGYSLLAASRRGPEASIISPETGKMGGGRYNNAPCLDSDWGDEYFANLRKFYEYTGFSLFEHDGSYPGDRCASTKHHHRGAGDSQWEQFKVITSHYKWCLANNVYLNVPRRKDVRSII